MTTKKKVAAKKKTSPKAAATVQVTTKLAEPPKKSGWDGTSAALRTGGSIAEAYAATVARPKGATKVKPDTKAQRVAESKKTHEVIAKAATKAGKAGLPKQRDIVMDEVSKYGRYIIYYTSVTPGITGLWQISGRNDIADFADWVRLDLAYIDQWSLWLDFKILLATIPAALFGRGAR